MSTYIHNGKLGLKSKNAIISPLVNDARKVLTPELNDLLLAMIEKYNCTIDMEYTSPQNKIVLDYNDTKLVILSARYHESGEYIDRNLMLQDFPKLSDYIVEGFIIDESFIPKVDEMKGIEGFVIKNGESHFKVKTNEYRALHKMTDRLSKEDVMDLFLENKLDYYRNNNSEALIKSFEEIVVPKYVDVINKIELFYEENRDLPIKEYSLKAKDEFDKKTHVFAINRLLGKDYEKSLIRKFKKYWK
ncbi:hypothetical protein GEMRC1_001244 [Eukaryota sp. GEM-RC1]